MVEPLIIWEIIRYFARFLKKYMIDQKSIERPWELNLKSFRKIHGTFKVYHEGKMEKPKKTLSKQDSRVYFSNSPSARSGQTQSNLIVPTNRRKRISKFNIFEPTNNRRKIASTSNDIYYEFYEIYEFGTLILRCMGISKEAVEGMKMMNKNDYREFLDDCITSLEKKYGKELTAFVRSLLVYEVMRRMKIEQFVSETNSHFSLNYKVIHMNF